MDIRLLWLIVMFVIWIPCTMDLYYYFDYWIVGTFSTVFSFLCGFIILQNRKSRDNVRR